MASRVSALTSDDGAVNLGTYPGPAILGHDPVVLGDQRKNLLDSIEGTGIVQFRDSPALPFLNTL